MSPAIRLRRSSQPVALADDPHSAAESKEIPDGTTVIIGGLASSIEKRLTKQNKLLGIIHLEDLAGKAEVVAYSELIEKIATGASVATTRFSDQR